jgi:hypothetical protein
MGLPERRALKKFEDEIYPKLQTRINEAAGFDVPMTVKWDSLAEEGYGDLYEEAFHKVFFKPLLNAIKGVCIDDIGREALRDGLKSVKIQGEGSSDVSFAKGVLSLTFNPVANLDEGSITERAKAIQAALEKGL